MRIRGPCRPAGLGRAAPQAASGLIITTSSFAPGTREVRTARGYAIGEADRRTLRQWVDAMRTPGAGVLLGE